MVGALTIEIVIHHWTYCWLTRPHPMSSNCVHWCVSHSLPINSVKLPISCCFFPFIRLFCQQMSCLDVWGIAASSHNTRRFSHWRKKSARPMGCKTQMVQQSHRRLCKQQTYVWRFVLSRTAQIIDGFVVQSNQKVGPLKISMEGTYHTYITIYHALLRLGSIAIVRP